MRDSFRKIEQKFPVNKKNYRLTFDTSSTYQSSVFCSNLAFTSHNIKEKKNQNQSLRQTYGGKKYKIQITQIQTSMKPQQKYEKLKNLKQQCSKIINSLQKAKTQLGNQPIRYKNRTKIQAIQQNLQFNDQDKSIVENDKATCPSQAQLSPIKQQMENFLYKKSKYYIKNYKLALQKGDLRTLDHFYLSLKVFKNLDRLRIPSEKQIHSKKVFLTKNIQDINKNTIFLDLDQTLIHCLLQDDYGDYDISIKYKSNKQKLKIRIRPYALSFIKRLSKYFQLIVFTAGNASYANSILDQIDPERQYIKHRLYRQHCIYISEQIYIKDLRIVNRDLKNCLIVDNAPYSYAYQLQNAVPILPFQRGSDQQLIQLQKYLMNLAGERNIAQFNRQYFKLHQYHHFQQMSSLTNNLYHF